MDPVTRRSFLVKGSAAAVGASAVAAGGLVLSKAGAENEPALSAEELEGAGDGPRAPPGDRHGGRQGRGPRRRAGIAFTDKALVAKVLRATR